MYRVLVTGATGMLGKDVSSLLARTKGYDVYNLVRRESTLLPGRQIIANLEDVAGLASVMREVRPDCIVHCAALTDLERCERDRTAAYKLNVDVVRQLVRSMPANGRFVYISTDSVFDGECGMYDEGDTPGPLNYYAETKLMGEQAALEMVGTALVLRTNLYGFHVPHGSSLVEWALDNLSQGQAIKGFDDVFFNPLYTRQVAELIRQLIPRCDVAGILNIGASEGVSKYDFLRRLSETFGFGSNLLDRATSRSIQFAAKRPLNTTLDCSRLCLIVGYLPLISEGLEQLKKDYEAFSE